MKLGAAVLGALLGGCVSSETYQRTETALGAERARLERARIEQRALLARVAELDAELTAARSRLSEQEQRVEQSELGSSIVRQERDRIASLADQLREELGRAGDHLRAFSAEKRELRQGLEACGLGEQSFVALAEADPGSAELGQPRSEVLVAEPAH